MTELIQPPGRFREVARRKLADARVEAAIESPHHPRIFVDCTANPQMPAAYERLLAAGVSVVAANKVGFAGSSQSFNQLREVAGRGASVYYETTVGAGLPVLRTVADLAATGDQILRIQGVLSGTLGYLCDEVMKGRVFSEAVKGAFDLGYNDYRHLLKDPDLENLRKDRRFKSLLNRQWGKRQP